MKGGCDVVNRFCCIEGKALTVSPSWTFWSLNKFPFPQVIIVVLISGSSDAVPPHFWVISQ